MTEFSELDYKLAGHLTPWHENFSALGYIDLKSNPYGFSTNPIDDKDVSYAIAKVITMKHLANLNNK